MRFTFARVATVRVIYMDVSLSPSLYQHIRIYIYTHIYGRVINVQQLAIYWEWK